jgi:hypothetical protein
MSASWRALRAEMLKLKHTLALWMVLILPLAVATLIVLTGSLYSPAPARPVTPTAAWQGLASGMFLLWCLLMVPLFVTLETALLAGLEHGNEQWKHLLALPVPPGVHYLAKLFMMVLMVLAAYLLLYILILPAGWILMITAPNRGLAGLPPLANLWQLPLASFGASMLIVALQTWIALRWRSFTTAVSIGIVATVASFIVGQSRFGNYFPWTLPGQMFHHGSNVHLTLALGLCGSVLVAVLGLADFLHRESP